MAQLAFGLVAKYPPCEPRHLLFVELHTNPGVSTKGPAYP
jgi:hypothetical protein